MTSTEVAIYRSMDLPERQQYALVIAKANALLGKALRAQTPEETAARAFLIMETGDMLGLHPAAALTGINVIEGKPSLSSALMSALIRGAGHKLHLAESGTIEEGNYKVTATLVREDDPDHPFTSTWTPHRAARAKLCAYTLDEATGMWRVISQSQQGNPLPWQLYTESLCKSRAISEVARDGGQDVLLGIRYTDEELLAGIAEDGGAPALEATLEEEPGDRPVAAKRPTNGRQGTRRKRSAPVDKPEAPEEAPSAPEEPAAPAEDIVDADVVEDAPSEPQEPVEATPEPEPTPDPAEEAERLERERIAEEQMAAERAKDDAPAEEPGVTPEMLAKFRERQAAEVERQHAHLQATKPSLDERLAEAKAADEAPGFRDAVTGQVFETQGELDAAIKARHADKTTRDSLASWDDPTDGPALASAYEVASGEEFEQESPNYQRLVDACVNQRELRDMYTKATERGHMNTALRALVVSRKAELPE